MGTNSGMQLNAGDRVRCPDVGDEVFEVERVEIYPNGKILVHLKGVEGPVRPESVKKVETDSR